MAQDSKAPVAKFTGHKVSKVRWKPVLSGGLVPSDVFASGTWDDDRNRICLWTCTSRPELSNDDGLSSNQPSLICTSPHPGDVTDIQFLDQERLVVASSTGSLHLHRHAANSQILMPLHSWKNLHRHAGVHGSCSCTSVSVNALDIATVGEDGTIHVLRADRALPLWTSENADSTSLNTVVFLKVSELLTASSFGHLKVWDIRTPSKSHSKLMLLSGGETASIQCAARHPDQAHIVACGDSQGVLSIWDMRHERHPVTLMEAHQDTIWEVRFHPSAPNNIFTCSQDGSAFHWDGSMNRSVQLAAANAVGGVLSSRLGDAMVDSNPWLSGDHARSRVDVIGLLPACSLPVNSIDVESLSHRVLCGADNQAIYLTS